MNASGKHVPNRDAFPTPLIKNVGYAIIRRKRVAGTVIVLGENPGAVRPYVTWLSDGFGGCGKFYAGHYFTKKNAAITDFRRRVRLERRISGC